MKNISFELNLAIKRKESGDEACKKGYNDGDGYFAYMSRDKFLELKNNMKPEHMIQFEKGAGKELEEGRR
jgi:hypothetical protein